MTLTVSFFGFVAPVLSFAKSHVPLKSTIFEEMKPKWNELDEYNFDSYVADFRLTLTPQEYDYRKGLFNAELLRVKSHNAKNLSWKEGINRYSMLTAEEKRTSQGLMKRKYPKHIAKNYYSY